MGNCLPIIRPPNTNGVPIAASTMPMQITQPAVLRRSSSLLSFQHTEYDVFISHAGEDKATIALPLREELRARGITAFVDDVDIQPGVDAKEIMIHAMETAKVAVIVLSPEFVARKWPIKELFCFLRRYEECITGGRIPPVIIPFFYRLSVAELYHEPRLDRRDLYRKSRFHQRKRAGEPEANVEGIKRALMKLHGIMGVRNDVEASNDPSYVMSQRRNVLLQQLCEKVGQTVRPRARELRFEVQSIIGGQSQGPVDKFRAFFPPSSCEIPAVLNFNERGKDGNPTTEGLVKQHLLQHTGNSPRVLSILGIGGVGKSTIMRALCVDNEIRQRFPDGMHIITLGENASNTTLVRKLCQVLKDSGAKKAYESLRTKNDMDAVLRFFESWFDEKKCAFFIDDVWSHDIELDSILRLCSIWGTGGNCVVMTTREPKVAAHVAGARIIRLEPRGAMGLEAQQILFFHAGLQDIDPSSILVDDSIKGILDICAGLPVALAAAGMNIRRMITSFVIGEQEVWKQYLSKLEACREELLNQDVGQYKNLYVTFLTSISVLDQQRQENSPRLRSRLLYAQMHRRLCVLRKQEAVPDSMLTHLWETESEKQVEEIATKFVESGLASRVAVPVGDKCVWYLSLHDSLHDFAVAQAKLNNDLMDAHECLLNGYKSCDPEISREVTGTSSWWSPKLKADGYIHRNLCRHLVEAGRTEELVHLLLSPQWVKRQMEANDILYLESDFALGILSVEQRIRETSGEELVLVKEALGLISEAVELASSFISKNIAEVWFQLQGRLRSYRERNKAIENYLAWIEVEGARPLILCNTSCLGEPGTSNRRIVSLGSGPTCMAVISDEQIACGCWDGQIFIVNIKRNVVEKQWKAHDRNVLAIAVGSDRTWLVSGSQDNTAKVWKVANGDIVTCFRGHSDYVNGVAVIGEERQVVSVSSDGTGRVWDAETGNVLSGPIGGQGVIGRTLSKLLTSQRGTSLRCVTALPNQDVVVTGGKDEKLRMWDVATGAQVGPTFDSDDWVRCLSVTPDGLYVVSGSRDWTLSVWDAESHQQIGHSLKGHTFSVKCVTVSGDGSRLASGSLDRTIRLWDLNSQTEICDPLEGHSNTVSGVAFVDGEDHLVSCSLDGTVRLWDVTRKVSRKPTNRHKKGVSSVSFSPDGRFAMSGSWDNTLRIWDTRSGEQVGDPLDGHSDTVTDLAFTPDGQSVVSVSRDETVCVWNFESRKVVHTLKGHNDYIRCVAVTPQGRIVTGSDDKTVRIWGLPIHDGNPVVLCGHNTSVRRVFLLDEGLRVVSVDEQDNIFVWDLESLERVLQYRKEGACKLSRREVLTIVGERTVHDDTMLSIPLWGRQIFYGQGPDARVLATLDANIDSWALSPDKKLICVGLEDGKVAFLKLERS